MRKRVYKLPYYKDAFIRDAMQEAFHITVDQLDVNSDRFPAREPTVKSVNWVITHLLQSGRPNHFTFIERPESEVGFIDHFELGGSTIGGDGPDYFLWIKLSIELAERLIEKYNLKEM